MTLRVASDMLEMPELNDIVDEWAKKERGLTTVVVTWHSFLCSLGLINVIIMSTATFYYASIETLELYEH